MSCFFDNEEGLRGFDRLDGVFTHMVELPLALVGDDVFEEEGVPLRMRLGRCWQ